MATLGGLRNAGWSYKEIARLTGKSDSYVRQAFGGNKRTDRRITDQLRQQNYRDLTNIVHQKTGNTRPSRLTPPPPPPVVRDDTSPPKGIIVGKQDTHDKNGNVKKYATREITNNDIAKLVAEAIARYGNGRPWGVAIFGEFMPEEGYAANAPSGMHRGWVGRKLMGDPRGEQHPVYRITKTHTDLLNETLKQLPKGMTPEVDKQLRQEIRASYATGWAEDMIGHHWTAVYAVKIWPAKMV